MTDKASPTARTLLLIWPQWQGAGHYDGYHAMAVSMLTGLCDSEEAYSHVAGWGCASPSSCRATCWHWRRCSTTCR